MTEWQKNDYPNPPEWKKTSERWKDEDGSLGAKEYGLIAALLASLLVTAIGAASFFGVL